MLSSIEKVIFLLALIASMYGAYYGAKRIIGSIRRGHGKVDWGVAKKRIVSVFLNN